MALRCDENYLLIKHLMPERLVRVLQTMPWNGWIGGGPMQPSRILLPLLAALALTGLGAPPAQASPQGYRGARFYGPHVRFGFTGYRYRPYFSYGHYRPYRYWPYRYYAGFTPYYYRSGVYLGAYPTAVYAPYQPYQAYQGYQPYQGYAFGSGAVRTLVELKETQVFVDGYYAGIVDDFDGTFQKLYLQPGEHTIELRLEGYQTFQQRIFASPSHTQKIHHQMVPLGPGEMNPESSNQGAVSPERGALSPSAVPPAAAKPVERRPGAERGVRAPTDERGEAESRSEKPWGLGPAAPIGEPPPPPEPAPPSSSPLVLSTGPQFGVLTLRVQPAEADVYIDGEHWGALGGIEELSIHLPAGRHRIELRREGDTVFATEVEIRRGEATPLNIRLTL